MSARKLRLIFTPRAQADVRAIRRYTVRQWGAQQHTIYRAEVMTAVERLTEFPSLGTAAPHVAADAYAFPVEQYVIYYRFGEQTLTVLAIVHARMDASQLGPL